MKKLNYTGTVRDSYEEMDWSNVVSLHEKIFYLVIAAMKNGVKKESIDKKLRKLNVKFLKEFEPVVVEYHDSRRLQKTIENLQN